MEQKLSLDEISLIAFTNGPGLLGPLLTGAAFAKTLAWVNNIRSIEIDHLEAHIFSAMISEKNLQPPFISLLVSGGHTLISKIDQHNSYEIIGKSLDDSAGEVFDKVARKMGLKYPGGPEISMAAEKTKNSKYNFPRPMLNSNDLNFSFSGLKTNFKRFLEKNLKNDKFFIEKEINNLCASLQLTITEILFEKVKLAAKQKKILNIVFGGGVSANTKIRGIFKNENNLKLYFPKLEYTTDNAAMIAIVGYLKFKDNLFSELNLESKARYTI